MRDIFTHQDYTRVGYFKSILDAENISCIIRNEYTHSTMSEMPAGIFFPTLSVVHDEDYDRAIEILRPHYQPEASPKNDWICPSCGETLPGSFEICWKCEAPPAESNG